MLEVAIHRDADRLDVYAKLRKFGTLHLRDCTRHAVGLEADVGNIPAIEAIPGVIDCTDGDEMIGGFLQTHELEKYDNPLTPNADYQYFAMQALGLSPEKLFHDLNVADHVYERLEAGVDGAGVVVGVPDNLIDISGGHHNEFDGRLIAGPLYNGYPSDATHNHGNWVAQIAAGASHGIAPGAQIAHARGLNQDNQGSTTHLINAADAIGARHDAQPEQHIINCSWGGSAAASYYAMALDLLDSGVPVIVAIGNSGDDLGVFGVDIYPAESPGTIAVGGLNTLKARHPSSNYGFVVDVWAGYGPWRCVNENGSYSTINGTSFASPCVMGIAALLLEGRPKMTTYAEALAFQGELLSSYTKRDVNVPWGQPRIEYPGKDTIFSLTRTKRAQDVPVPPDPPVDAGFDLLHAFAMGASLSGHTGTITFGSIYYDRGSTLGLTGTPNQVVVPADVHYATCGIFGGDSDVQSNYNAYQIYVNGSIVALNAHHLGDYHAGHACNLFPVEEGDVITFAANFGSAGDADVRAWGRFYG